MPQDDTTPMNRLTHPLKAAAEEEGHRQTATRSPLPDYAEWANKVHDLVHDDDEDQAGAHEEEEEDFYDEDYEDAGAGFFALVWDYKIYVVAFALVFVVLLGGLLAARGGGEAPAPARPDAPAGNAKPEAAAAAPGADLPVKDTGVVIEDPVLKEDPGTYYLRAGEIAWKGKLEKTDTGEELTLEGPTAAQFKNASFDQSSVMTGVFGRAEPGKPIIHATFHRTTIGEEETTSGTYYAIADNAVIAEGTYEDTRDGKEITRTYNEHAPGSASYDSYRVSFEAPSGVPVPVLVGWEPPAEVEKDEAA